MTRRLGLIVGSLLLIAALAFTVLAITADDRDCQWDEAMDVHGECVPCPHEATPQTPCFGLIGYEL